MNDVIVVLSIAPPLPAIYPKFCTAQGSELHLKITKLLFILIVLNKINSAEFWHAYCTALCAETGPKNPRRDKPLRAAAPGSGLIRDPRGINSLYLPNWNPGIAVSALQASRVLRNCGDR
ncbi:MAG TPA: hypothetical protein VEK75_01405 [Xanthobacteraceae bacterium]|nr:hypothetical protein [Xanthobacteraceae bacterium]